MKRQDRKSNCPTNYALETFGDSWSLLIVRDLMFMGKRTYSEFANSDERISTNILSDRLRSLTSAGVVRREVAGKRSAYFLTQKGLDLLPAMVELIVWSAKHDANSAADEGFVRRATRDRAQLLAELDAKLRTEHGL